MAEENTPDPKDDPQAGVFNVDRVRELVGLMNEHELSEIDLRHGEQRVRLRRGPEQAVLAATPAAAPIASAPAAQPAPVQAPPAETPAAVAPAAGKTINSPMVGTFYTSSSPDTAAFVKVGDQVGPDTTVCIVEAMKVFNEIPAELSGKITEILAENGAAVEFGQPLFRVE